MAALVLSIISSKGGVGKTTLTANLGGLLADAGNQVLLIDADVQPTLSNYYELQDKSAAGLTHVALEASTDNAISQTVIPRLDLIYSDDPKSSIQKELPLLPGGWNHLRMAVNKLADQYDFILIDTQGAIGPLQDAAIAAADIIISPIVPDMVSASEFGRRTLSRIHLVDAGLEPLGIRIAPILGLLCKVDHTRDAKMFAQGIRDMAVPDGLNLRILDHVIPASVVYRRGASLRTPVHRIEKKRPNGNGAGEVMHRVWAEIMNQAQTLIPGKVPGETQAEQPHGHAMQASHG